MGRIKNSRCDYVRSPNGTPRTSSLFATLCLATAPSKGWGFLHLTEAPPRVYCVVPSSRCQSSFGSFRMKKSADTRRCTSDLGLSMVMVRSPSRMYSKEGSSPRTSPTRQSNSLKLARLKLCSLRDRQEAWQ